MSQEIHIRVWNVAARSKARIDFKEIHTCTLGSPAVQLQIQEVSSYSESLIVPVPSHQPFGRMQSNGLEITRMEEPLSLLLAST